MKILPASLLVVALTSSPFFLPTAAGKEEEVLNFIDMHRNSDGTYEKGYEYSFGDWEKKAVQVPAKGLVVNLTGSKGGVGDNGGIDIGKFTRLRFSFVLSNRNRAKSFVFSLTDKDGTDQSFEVSLEGVPRGVEQKFTVDLTKPTRVDAPGSVPGLNLAKLKVWQLKGNYQDEPIEILFLRIAAVTG